jgi:hypothetical protein
MCPKIYVRSTRIFLVWKLKLKCKSVNYIPDLLMPLCFPQNVSIFNVSLVKERCFINETVSVFSWKEESYLNSLQQMYFRWLIKAPDLPQ